MPKTIEARLEELEKAAGIVKDTVYIRVVDGGTIIPGNGETHAAVIAQLEDPNVINVVVSDGAMPREFDEGRHVDIIDPYSLPPDPSLGTPWFTAPDAKTPRVERGDSTESRPATHEDAPGATQPDGAATPTPPENSSRDENPEPRLADMDPGRPPGRPARWYEAIEPRCPDAPDDATYWGARGGVMPELPPNEPWLEMARYFLVRRGAEPPRVPTWRDRGGDEE